MRDEWRASPLESLLELVIDHRGKTPKKLGFPGFTDTGVPVVSAIHIKRGRIIWGERERFAPTELFEKWMPVRLRRGDVLLTSEAPLGEVAQIKTNDPVVLSQRLFALRGKEGVLDDAFLAYYLQSERGQSELHRRATGTTVLGIRQSELRRVAVEYPSFEEQRAISEVLGSLDDLIDTNKQLMSALDEAAFCAYAQVASSAQQTAAFGAVASLVRDTVPTQALPASTNYLGLEHFSEGGGGLTGIGRASDTVSVKARFAPGDILYGKLRPYFRKVARPDFAGVCSTEIWVLRPSSDMVSTYLHQLVGSQPFSDFATAGSDGTKMPRASWSHVAQYVVPLPEMSDLMALERELDPMWRMHGSLRVENEALTRTRDELLPLLMSGAVSVGEVAP